jgi:putative lipoprotein
MTHRDGMNGLMLGVAVWLAGCSAATVVPVGGGGGVAKVTGTVTYRERMALPPTAVIKVQLADVSRADAPAVVLGEQVIQAAGNQVPFTFEVTFDPAQIVANHTYAVQARIEDDGKLRFISDQRYAVITGGAPITADILLKPVGASR